MLKINETLVQVSIGEVNEAAFNFKENKGDKYNVDDFWAFVDDQDRTPMVTNYYTFNEEGARKIRLLTSPHHRTFLKIHETQHADD